jgi:hypothetical protein
MTPSAITADGALSELAAFPSPGFAPAVNNFFLQLLLICTIFIQP